jgi:hypothetical protein
MEVTKPDLKGWGWLIVVVVGGSIVFHFLHFNNIERSTSRSRHLQEMAIRCHLRHLNKFLSLDCLDKCEKSAAAL